MKGKYSMRTRLEWFAVVITTLAVAALLFGAPVAAKPKDPGGFHRIATPTPTSAPKCAFR